MCQFDRANIRIIKCQIRKVLLTTNVSGKQCIEKAKKSYTIKDKKHDGICIGKLMRYVYKRKENSNIKLGYVWILGN